MTSKTLKAFLLAFCVLSCTHSTLGNTFSESSRYDIIISEIMAKPSPTIGLPDVEYLELHNRLPYPVTLHDWRLTLGTTSKNLPEITIDSCGYAVLIAQKYQEVFSPYCENLYTLSSLAITNGGQALTLFDNNGEIIHYVCFKSEWHSEKIKQEGGWSLEIIDENWPCAGRWNWNSSTDPLGGTPGRPNSIRAPLFDNTPPTITGVTMPDSQTVRIHLSKTLTSGFWEPNVFQTRPEIPILDISEVPPEFSSIDIQFSESISAGTNYTLHLAGEFGDCGGNTWQVDTEIPFGKSCLPQESDLVINEVLTSAFGEVEADYLELYNRSNKIIDLKDLKVGYGGDTLPQKAIFACSKGRQMPPESYIVLCRQKATTIEQYICRDENALIECDSLPDFAIAQGIIHITDRSLRPIDRLNYSDEMHYDKLLSTKGVALERLYADRPTQDENNWRSAAESAGYGTPGYQNSQSGNALETDGFEVIPEVFSPNNDGLEDYCEIICKLTEAENQMNIVLYNNRGYLVKHLANNILCGSEAWFRWDGTDDNEQPAPAGMYVAQIECWNLHSGKRTRKRKVVSIYR